MIKALSCIIVEDEKLSRASLSKLCEKSDSLELIESFERAEEATRAIESGIVDLVFLDIELPGISGIEWLESLAYLPQIIFTTSNKSYAFEAYEYDITDFLKKPISQSRFAKAVAKAVSIHQLQNEMNLISSQQELYVRIDKKYIRIDIDKIQYFENIGDYVKVVTDNGNFVVYKTLKSINTQIRHPRFLKIHRSYIVNLARIKDIEDSSLVIGSKVIPISRVHRPVLFKSINILS